MRKEGGDWIWQKAIQAEVGAGHVAEPGAGTEAAAERETGTRHDSPRLEKASNIRESVPVKSDGGFTWYARVKEIFR